MTLTPLRNRASECFRKVQSAFCSELESFEPNLRFESEDWKRPDLRDLHGGGGCTRIMRGGRVFEQAGVNFSEVSGTLPVDMVERLTGIAKEESFFAAGISTVVHPLSPLVPTTHANLRYLEVGEKRWFGGGMDLTPYVLFDEDAIHFHQTLKTACDEFDTAHYPKFKKWCDQYFFLPHRGETRGIGGIFFDYLGRDSSAELEMHFNFVERIGSAIPSAYAPIVSRRKDLSWTSDQKHFQLVRRGRYVEFNLLYDRGTLFGLKTSGRTESILMSLPPEVRWEYNYAPVEGSPESALLAVLRNPREWVS